MEKIPLFVNFPVSESVLQAFPAIDETGGFYFHILKLDLDLFALMIDARPCVAVFSIPDYESRQEVCGLLESFGRLRESLGYPKRDPTLRTILVAEEKAVSLERWHDLGVHEFIIAPILPRALAYKISRHHLRASTCPVPEPYRQKDDVMVVRGSPKLVREEKPYGRGPREELPLSEVTNPSRGIRSFVGERPNTPTKYSVLTSIPELRAEDGHWERPAEDPREPDAAQDPRWNWAWNRPQDKSGARPSWNYRGERPEYDPKRRAWKLSGESPALEVRREGSMPEKLIDTLETPRGREIVVHSPEERGKLDVLEVVEARQTSPTGTPVGRGSAGIGGNPGQEPSYRDRTRDGTGPESSWGRRPGSPTGPSEEKSRDDEDESGENSQAEGQVSGTKKPGWTQHISQSQRSLERTLMTEHDRERKEDWHVDLSSSSADAAELPPELEEISRQLMGDSAKPETQPVDKPEGSAASSEETFASDPVLSESAIPPELDAISETSLEQEAETSAPEEEEIPANLFPDDPAEDATNPYLDGRESPGTNLDTQGPDSVPVLGGSGRPNERDPSFPSRELEREKTTTAPRGAGSEPLARPENLTALESSKLASHYNTSVGSGRSTAEPERNVRLGNAQDDDEGNMKLQSTEAAQNTWSMQNLDELSGQIPAKKRPESEAPSAEKPEPAAEEGTPEEIQLFETGEKPSLQQIALLAEQMGEHIPGAIDGTSLTPEQLEAALREAKTRNKAWYGRFWRRVQVLLERMRRS